MRAASLAILFCVEVRFPYPNLFITAIRSWYIILVQLAISFLDRPQPMHSPVNESILQIEMQGETYIRTEVPLLHKKASIP